MALELKPTPSLADRLKTIDQISAEINEKAGVKLVGRIGKDPDIMDKLAIKFIPSACLDFNAATGGGYPRGRCTIISGLADAGKSLRVLEDIGKSMRDSKDFLALWVESEKSLEKNNICQTFQIDPERFVFIEYDENKGAEGILDILYAFMKAVNFDMVCINSLKCLTPKKILEEDMNNQIPAIAARLNSLMTQKFTALVANSNAAFILITHQYTGIGTYGAPMVLSGGHAIKYWAALILSFSRPSIGTSDPISKDEGVHIKVSVKKNHCVPDRNPYVNFEYYAIFGEGTDNTIPIVNKLVEAGIVNKGGAYYKFKLADGTEVSQQGTTKFRQYLKNNPEVFEDLVKRLNGDTSTVKSMTAEEIDQAKSEEEETAKMATEMQAGAAKQKKKKV